MGKYVIRGDTITRKQELVYDANGKIRSLSMPDIEGDLPSRIIYAKYPIDAIKKYWKALDVEFRSADIYAFEGDRRVMLIMITKTEMEMKHELQVNELGFTFMDYLFSI